MGRKRINKAERIRAAFESMGLETRPRDIIAALKSERVSVSSAQVSNIRARMSAVGSVPKRSKPGPRGNAELSLAGLQAAKALLDEAGSLEAARQTLAALAKLI